MEQRRREATIWTRGLCVAALAGPALGLGAVHPISQPIVALVVLGWVASLRGAPTRWPKGLAIFVALAGMTALQALPLPAALASGLAPVGHDAARELWQGGPEPAWLPLSVAPGLTAFEAARLCILAAVVWAAAQTPWQEVARAAAWAALAVLAVGLLHLALDAQQIYAVYSPRTRASTSSLLTSFVNPNHQAGLFLLGCFSAWALRRDELRRAGRDNTASIAWGVAALALAGGIALSVPRGAAAALLVGSLAGALWRGDAPRPQRRTVVVVVSSLSALVAVVAIAMPGLSSRLIALWGPEGAGSKFETAHAALALIPGAPWLGTGRGTAIDLLPLVGLNQTPVTTHIEVAPVTMLVEWGPLVGGAALLALLATLGATARYRVDARRVLAVGLAAWALHNVVDFNWEYLGTAVPAAALFGTLVPRVRPAPRLGPRLAVLLCALGLAASAALVGVADPLAAPHPEAIHRARTWRPLDARVHLALARTQLERANAASSPAERTRAIELAGVHAAAAARLRATVDAAVLHAELAYVREDFTGFADAVAQGWARADALQRRGLMQWLARDPDPLRRLSIASAPPHDAAEFYAIARVTDPAWARSLTEGRLVFDPEDPDALESATRLAQARDDAPAALESARRWSRASPGSGAALSAYALAIADQDPTQLETALVLVTAQAANLEQPELVIIARAQLRLRAGHDLRTSQKELRAALNDARLPTARKQILTTLRRVDDALGRDARGSHAKVPPASSGDPPP